METKNLVDAIVQQKPTEIKDSINALMTQKAFGQIASYKQELAKSMFVGDLDENMRVAKSLQRGYSKPSSKKRGGSMHHYAEPVKTQTPTQKSGILSKVKSLFKRD